jgi:hypothetical protein
LSPLAAAQPDGDWLDRLSAFKCKHSIQLDALSVDPLQFAMTAACWRKQPRPEPHQGPYSLITVDAAREELRVLRISAFNPGGIHYARDGRVIWFSALNQALIGQEQRFVEAFSLEPQALAERSLGRIELPFVIGSTTFTKGVDCHALRVQGRRNDGDPVPEHRFLLFGDGDPIASGRLLTGIEHVWFFEPRGRLFVVETQAADGAPANAAHRAALDCSGQILPLDDELARRLANVEKPSGRYRAAATGDLLVDGYARNDGKALLFRGVTLTAFAPRTRCYGFDQPDEACVASPAAGRGWSPSGEHFALLQPEGTLEVYRTADLAVVHAQPIELDDSFLFIDDRAVYHVTARGRFRREAWR